MLAYLYRNIISISREILKNIPRTMISSFGIVFLITFIVISVSLKKSITEFLETRIFGQLQINQIRISPVNITTMAEFSSDKNEISAEKVKKIKKMMDVENIQEVIRLNQPAYIKAGMFGRYLRSDMLISGVDRTFFKGSLKNWKDFTSGDVIPIVLPKFVMNLYNNFAAANVLPEISERALELLTIEITIGKSSFVKTRQEGTKYDARLFGLTPAITSGGLIVPSEFIKNYCLKNVEKKEERDKCYSCIMIIADVKNNNKIAEVTKTIKKLALDVESQADVAEKTGKAVKLVDVILGLIMIIILFLTIIAIFNSYLAITYHRSDKISIQRILGASKIRIVMIFIVEAAIVGAFYGAVGYYLGYYITGYISKFIDKWVPLLKGLNMKIADHSLLYLSLSISAAVSSISALIPGIFASNMNLFNASKK
ncbi:MAG: hypothetical protein MUC95_03730 [Spirochaetes bacterium]|nr:hypothetical protein [Spirochaetota bacterium]